MNWYIKVIKQYIDFKGRARRKEYWMFVLFNAIFSIVAILIDRQIGLNFNVIDTLYSLFVLLPGLAVSVRRLHDIGKGGGWIFISLIPIIGWIWLIVLTATEGEHAENRFGADPKE